ncbi:hypothetical protein [Nocardia brasiliensis]|uniref:hypothetical protein n=1 Tax=Nocardia brasiliensis TaxID=37326 RepID=UPI003D91D3D4
MSSELRGWGTDIARAVLGSVFVIGFAWVVAAFVSVYDVVAWEDADGGARRYLAVAQFVAFAGIVGAVLWAVLLMVGKVRARRPVGWTPVVAVPVIIGAWVAGLLVAIVLVAV